MRPGDWLTVFRWAAVAAEKGIPTTLRNEDATPKPLPTVPATCGEPRP